MAIYAIDFDNTLAITRFPEIVAPNKKMVAFAKAVKAQGHQIILWTSRAGADLENAVEWCRLQGLVFDAVNEPLPEQIKRWGNDTRKIYADYYIDDKNKPGREFFINRTCYLHNTEPTRNKALVSVQEFEKTG